MSCTMELGEKSVLRKVCPMRNDGVECDTAEA
jgi:hypothetical protein